jgi:hypothetical protein
MQNLWPLCHCSLVLAFLGVFIRRVACRLGLRRCQPILFETAYNHLVNIVCYFGGSCRYWLHVSVIVVVVR